MIQTPSASTSGHINIPTDNLPGVSNIPGLPSDETPGKGTMTIDVSQTDIKPDERVMEIDVSENPEVPADVSDVLSEAISEATSTPAPQVQYWNHGPIKIRTKLGRIKINDPRLSQALRNHSNVTSAEPIIRLILSLN